METVVRERPRQATVWINRDLWVRAKKFAAEEEVALSVIVDRALEEYLKTRKTK